MEELDNILTLGDADLISVLPEYQQELVKTILHNSNNDYIEASNQWLNASIPNVAKFGGQGDRYAFREAVQLELEKYLCGDPAYKKERAELTKLGSNAKTFVISSITAAISQALGGAAPILAPVIVLLLINMGKISVNAWCAMRMKAKADS